MSFKSRGSKVFPESGGTPDLARVGSAAVDLLARSGSAASLGRTTSLRSQRSVRRAASNKARSSEQERGLHLGEEEHAAFLAERARREGRQGLRDLLAVYGRMLGPAAIVSVWMFALFAAISYSIPNLLCNRVAKENSVGHRQRWEPTTWCRLVPRFPSCLPSNLPIRAHPSLRRGAPLA